MYLQITQAAKLLKVSRQSVHTWINRGELTTAKIGGWRFVVEDERFKAMRRERAKVTDGR